MEKIKSVCTLNSNEYIWNQLKYFKDIDFTINKMNPDLDFGKSKTRNMKKQAKHIKYSILQAEEYFLACKHLTNLNTKPLLLYYGITSLANALVLLKKDSNYAFDMLRNKRKHNHHGLEKNFSTKGSSSLKQFLESIKCNIYLKKNEFWGAFGLFYSIIKPDYIKIKEHLHYINNENLGNKHFIGYNIFPCCNKLKIEDIQKRCFSLLDRIQYLPDMFYTLKDFSIESKLYSGSFVRHRSMFQVEKTDTIVDSFFLNDISKEKQINLIKYYEENYKKSNDINLSNTLKIFEERNCLNIKVKSKQSGGARIFLPDIVESILEEYFFIEDADNYLTEAANCYIIMYCLGMLARYYPDYWLKSLENNHIHLFLNDLINVIEIKFPKLIIDQMTNIKHIIKTSYTD